MLAAYFMLGLVIVGYVKVVGWVILGCIVVLMGLSCDN